MNFVKGHVTGPSQVECPLGKFSLSVPTGISVSSPVTLAIRPEHVQVKAIDGSPSGLSGSITSKNYLGDAALLEVEINGVTLLAKLAGDAELAVGEKASVDLPTHRWHVFP
jgi:ABC-type sugar transport system ATPase subunit